MKALYLFILSHDVQRKVLKLHHQSAFAISFSEVIRLLLLQRKDALEQTARTAFLILNEGKQK